MASQLEILDAIYADLQAILSESSAVSVAEPEDHAGLLGRHDGSTYPYFGIERFGGMDYHSGGIGGPERVAKKTTDADGNVTQHTKRRRKTLRVEMAAMVDDGDVRSSSPLLTEAEDHFAAYLEEKDLSDLHPDIREMDFDGRRDASRAGDGVVGERLRFDLVYYRDRTVDVTPIEQIDLDIKDTDFEIEYLNS